jgi:hypothetical protein
VRCASGRQTTVRLLSQVSRPESTSHTDCHIDSSNSLTLFKACSVAAGTGHHQMASVPDVAMLCRGRSSARQPIYPPFCVPHAASCCFLLLPAATEADACKNYPCTSTGAPATCTDIPGGVNYLTGRNCTCATGFTYSEAKGCVGMCSEICYEHMLLTFIISCSRAWHDMFVPHDLVIWLSCICTGQ